MSKISDRSQPFLSSWIHHESMTVNVRKCEYKPLDSITEVSSESDDVHEYE